MVEPVVVFNRPDGGYDAGGLFTKKPPTRAFLFYPLSPLPNQFGTDEAPLGARILKAV